MILFVLQFYPVCNFGGFINFGLGIVKSVRFKGIASGLELSLESVSELYWIWLDAGAFCAWFTKSRHARPINFESAIN